MYKGISYRFNAKSGFLIGTAIGTFVSIVAANDPQFKDMPLEQMVLLSGVCTGYFATGMSAIGYVHQKVLNPLLDRYIGDK